MKTEHGEINIKVLEVRHNTVKIGISAPATVPIRRKEVEEKK